MWYVALGWHAIVSARWQTGNTLQYDTYSGIMTLNLPGGSTLQCGRWLWDDMLLNSPKRPPYWNSTSGFDFDNITALDICHSAPVCEILSKSDTFGRNMMSCRLVLFRISAILDFRGPIMGFLKSPCSTSYRSSIETTALNCLVFENIAFLAFWRQTNRPIDAEQRNNTQAFE